VIRGGTVDEMGALTDVASITKGRSSQLLRLGKRGAASTLAGVLRDALVTLLDEVPRRAGASAHRDSGR